MARPHLQAQPRGQGARHARPIRQAIKTVRLDPCDGVSLGERDLRRRTVELARAEADPEAVATAVVGSLSGLRGRCRADGWESDFKSSPPPQEFFATSR